MIYLLNPQGIPTAQPGEGDYLTFYNSQNKPRRVNWSELNFSNSGPISAESVTGLVAFIQNTLIPAENIDGLVNIVQATPTSWQIRNSNFNAVANANYFIDNKTNQIIATLPANPATGDTVRFLLLGDKLVTFNRNGSLTLGLSNNIVAFSKAKLMELIFCDSANGWIPSDINNQFLSRPSSFNQLTINLTTLESYNLNGNPITILTDGNTTSGLIKDGGTGFRLRINFTNLVYANRIIVNTGQFNGNFNQPTGLQIFNSPNGIDNLVSTVSLNRTSNEQSFDLTNISALDSPVSNLSINFTGNHDTGDGSRQSIREIRLFGFQL
ncbi:hypothetical protein RIF25_09415 [Thermosynechococcaceae cyanobacterium BACA0444]|uniref:Uncharacterized protein n=1 Tax=Pseudocalidococcus azoricus BACA0444 TaxID=2918990 RepID=A0AAE4JWG7_9CYAN|nr:hypothetical protein [Pseudocalidococcus azoricus]MDS3861026.1 hypothetical protein [Pseudocalidococcus azoricus BACA0444]